MPEISPFRTHQFNETVREKLDRFLKHPGIHEYEKLLHYLSDLRIDEIKQGWNGEAFVPVEHQSAVAQEKIERNF